MAKRESRASARERQLAAALRVATPASCDVCVVGGGAAGLVAAIVAAEAGATVVVLEHDLECGRTILATGNGRCNFANVRLDPRRYNDPTFVVSVCGAKWLDDVLRFFRESGLRWCLEDDRLYPASRQAASVRNVLLARANKAGVTLAPARTVTRIEQPTLAGDQANVRFEPQGGTTQSLMASKVILATGGVNALAVDGLGLRSAPTSPVLCPVACEDSPLFALDGRRAHVQAHLTKAGSFFPSWQERGEVLFRSYGISGIVSFDLSRRAEAGDLVELDLAPDTSKSDLQQLVDPFARGDLSAGCLDGVLDPAIAAVLERLARQRWHLAWPERTKPITDSAALIALTKSLPFVVRGQAQTEQAQAMRGGLATGQFDTATLCARDLPWLYACGEALDVDADCGGFNLAWAWKSGLVAGGAAGRSHEC